MEQSAKRSFIATEKLMEKLDDDLTILVLKRLDKPHEVASAAAVSRSWNRLVIEGCLWRELCIKSFPEVEMFQQLWVGSRNHGYVPSSSGQDFKEMLEREHRIYSRLFYELKSPPVKRSCIMEPLSASSTDNFPEESIVQTLYPRQRFSDDETPSYWSSKGHSNADVSETLTYQLVYGLCVVHEVRIRPLQAYFQIGNPIYSSKYVRFRLGHLCRSSNSACDLASGSISLDHASSSKENSLTCAIDVTSSKDYVWTYVSPKFPMEQADALQSFKLPSPVLCMGGVFQVELLGCAQAQQLDQLYYICICHVNVVGRPLLKFDFDVSQTPGKFMWKCWQGADGVELFPGATLRALYLEDGAAAWTLCWRLLAEKITQVGFAWVIRQNRFLLDIMLRNLALATLLLHNDQEPDIEDEEELENFLA